LIFSFSLKSITKVEMLADYKLTEGSGSILLENSVTSVSALSPIALVAASGPIWSTVV